MKLELAGASVTVLALIVIIALFGLGALEVGSCRLSIGASGTREQTRQIFRFQFCLTHLYIHTNTHTNDDRVGCGGPGFSLSDVHSARSMENNALFFAEKKARLLVLLLVCVCLSVSVCGTSQLFGPQNLTGWQSHLIPGHNQTQNTTGDPLPTLAGGAQHVDLAAGPHPVARARAHPRYGFHSLYDDAPNPMLSRKGPPFFLK